jgi:hypothetical protein
VSAAAAIARAEAAGIRLRLLPNGQVEAEASAPLPPDALKELRRWRDDVAHLLALRAAAGGQSAEPPPSPEPDVWLAGIARSIRSALADGAVRVTDSEGWLVLVRPDGRRVAVTPHVAAQLAEAGLLPRLPGAVAEPGGDDPDAEAERAAIQAEPPLPPEGSVERERLDAEQARTVAGLLAASRAWPSCFEGSADRPPPKGAHCSACRGRWWWIPRSPKSDATAPSSHWRCSTCWPPAHVRKDLIVEVAT